MWSRTKSYRWISTEWILGYSDALISAHSSRNLPISKMDETSDKCWRPFFRDASCFFYSNNYFNTCNLRIYNMHKIIYMYIILSYQFENLSYTSGLSSFPVLFLPEMHSKKSYGCPTRPPTVVTHHWQVHLEQIKFIPPWAISFREQKLGRAAVLHFLAGCHTWLDHARLNLITWDYPVKMCDSHFWS